MKTKSSASGWSTRWNGSATTRAIPSWGDVVAAGVPHWRAPTNTQNPELELVFPFGRVSDDDELTELMRKTFANRRYPLAHDWAPDAVWAARLGLARDAANLAAMMLEYFQAFPSGFTFWSRTPDQRDLRNVFLEGVGVTAMAVQEMLLQSHDGLLRIGPAVPADWSGSFKLRALGGFLVSSEFDQGVPRYVGIESLLETTLRVRNPWPGEAVRLYATAGPTLLTTAEDRIEAPTTPGVAYVLERLSQPLSSFPFASITSCRNSDTKFLGRAQLGVGPAPPRADLTVDVNTAPVSGHGTRISVHVRNVGAMRSSATLVRLWDATDVSTWLGDVPIPAIDVGGSAEAGFDWIDSSVTAGVRKIKAVVNPDRELVEADGTNNEASTVVGVVATADSVVADEFNPENAVDSDMWTSWASSATDEGHWLQLDFDRPTEIARTIVRSRRLPRLVIHDLDVATACGAEPLEVRGGTRGNAKVNIDVELEPHTVERLRITVLRETFRDRPRQNADIAEIELYNAKGRRVL